MLTVEIWENRENRSFCYYKQHLEKLTTTFKNGAQFVSGVAQTGIICLQGTPYVLGQRETEQWYLFTMDNVSAGIDKGDVTLEILMSDLDQEAMAHFSKMKHETSEEVIAVSSTLHSEVTIKLRFFCYHNATSPVAKGLENQLWRISIKASGTAWLLAISFNIASIIDEIFETNSSFHVK